MKISIRAFCVTLLAALICFGGCQKDPQVLITPFVLKAAVPPEQLQDPPANAQPATNAYDEAVIK